MAFSIYILLIGAGINIVKCNHSGKYKIFSAVFSLGNNFSCAPSHGCMETEFVQYVPCVNPDYQAFDFHFEIPTIIKDIFYDINDYSLETQHYTINTKINPPPKDLLSIIKVFRI
ncbi:MAG: hypothetical protein IJ150_06820 [Bacteroidales bacterium]|nr:hypothetical protein [Bacteroidales bacterium]